MFIQSSTDNFIKDIFFFSIQFAIIFIFSNDNINIITIQLNNEALIYNEFNLTDNNCEAIKTLTITRSSWKVLSMCNELFIENNTYARAFPGIRLISHSKMRSFNNLLGRDLFRRGE